MASPSSPNPVAFIPPQASAAAGAIDLIMLVVTIVAVVFSVGIIVALVWLSVVYRKGNKVDRSNPPLENLPIEIAWTGIPLLIVLGLYVWSTVLYLENKRVPAGALEMFVTGKQWMWKVQHPEGRWENNELHVPIGRAVSLTMTSEDVIHSFFVPAFRVHQDVVPGEYTHLWFTPTLPGVYPLYCAQFCGTLHSQMVGTVTVMQPAEYEAWLTTGTTQESLAAAGQRLFIQHGCNGCHGPNAAVRAPSLVGIYGKPIPIQIPPEGVPPARLQDVIKTVPATTIIADSRYIHDSIVLPEKEIAAGFKPIMPTFKNRLKEEDILKIVAYIKSLANGPGKGVSDTRVREGETRTLSADEYQARVGFVPANLNAVTSGAETAPAAPGSTASQRAGQNQGRTTR
jgi:cytochrome c oxidase subunit 2